MEKVPEFGVYDKQNQQRNQIRSVYDTWWAKVNQSLHAFLCVNNSYSGSKVSGDSFPAGECEARLRNLRTEKYTPDLILIYLGFNDSDVKYQKSKLKKSFLRLSYYDSPNRANQNLLGYATVFMDSGKVFAKMIRGANRKKLYVKSGEETNTKYDNAKVDKEPCFENHNELSVEYVEEFRLSSQIVVSDRLSEASSEGFYMYLWEDNDNGAVPSDVYMRVDFNHAGYGRVVPMTMPYVYGTNDNHVMSIYDIADKWQNPSAENWGWGVRANEKYSYIHLKYMYDSDSKRHVYYLDPDTYGTGSYYDSTPDELEINLYEPKIRFQ